MSWHNFGSMARHWGMRGRDEFDRLQTEMERVYRDIKRPFVGGFPALNVWTNQDGALVTGELPGVALDDMEIHVTGNSLTIKGVRAPGEEKATYYRQERITGTFTRNVELPFKIDADSVEAKLKLGMLTIKVDRAEEDKPRKIKVVTG